MAFIIGPDMTGVIWYFEPHGKLNPDDLPMIF